ncbi:MAG: hypothetical protein NC821_06380, partial [Candidatus Omnitrophica bacterium]|nr:hypothetical protein [Candidatus Omnitrophota bacterium]
MSRIIFISPAINFWFVFLSSGNLARIRCPLSAQAKELQRILDDPQINKIDDEKLLLGGILDELLRIDRKYEDLYR